VPLWFVVDGDEPRDCWFDPVLGVLSRFVEPAFFVFDLSSVLPLPRVAMTRSPSKPFRLRSGRTPRSQRRRVHCLVIALAASEMPVCDAAIVPLSGLEYIGDFTSRASFPPGASIEPMRQFAYKPRITASATVTGTRARHGSMH
jgi:hypothetical protein